MKRFLVAAVAGLALASAVLGGGASAEDNARVRVIHASPDAPNVDVHANGSRVLSNVPFKAVSDYLSVPAGDYTLEVFAAGTSTNPVLTIDASLEAGVDYTVAAVDRVSQLKYRVYIDNNAAPAAGKAHVNVIHAGPDAPNVDIAVKGGPVLVPDLGFGEKAGPLPVDAGRYDLEVRAAGTTTVALPLNGVQLESGKVYTFIAMGLLGNSTLTVVPASITPAAAAPAAPGHVAPPRAGDAGLAAANDSATMSWLPILGISAAVVVGGLMGRRLIATRS